MAKKITSESLLQDLGYEIKPVKTVAVFSEDPINSDGTAKENVTIEVVFIQSNKNLEAPKP